MTRPVQSPMARRRPVAAAIATMALVSALGCAGDIAGGDCVLQGLAQMGRAKADAGSVTCALAAQSWIVAFPSNAEPGPTSGLPRQYWDIVRDSAAHGSNWCVSGEARGAPNGMTCRRLLLHVHTLQVVRARTFAVDLGRAPDGEGILQGLRAARP
jgi:hypothetical protein